MKPNRVHELGRHRAQLLGFALRRLRNREQAEDAVQDTLLAALEGLSGYAGSASLNTWLTGILKHKIVDCMRRTGREQALNPEDHDFVLPDSDPEASFERRGVFEMVELGLSRLSKNAARAFVLREVLGMDTAEVCRELAITKNGCHVMLHRARRRLQNCPEIRGLSAAPGTA